MPESDDLLLFTAYWAGDSSKLHSAFRQERPRTGHVADSAPRWKGLKPLFRQGLAHVCTRAQFSLQVSLCEKLPVRGNNRVAGDMQFLGERTRRGEFRTRRQVAPQNGVPQS